MESATQFRMLGQRVAELERSVRSIQIHTEREMTETWTAPPTGNNNNNFATHTNAEAFGIWMCHLPIPRRLAARRFSLVTTGAGSGAIAVYRAESPRQLDPRAPEARTKPLSFRLLKSIGQWASTASVILDLSQDLPLEPSAGEYYLGFQASGATLLPYCTPQPDSGFFASWKTGPLGTKVGDFPNVVKASGSLGYVPIVRVLSAGGVHLMPTPGGIFGSYTAGIGTPPATTKYLIQFWPQLYLVPPTYGQPGTTDYHIGTVNLPAGTYVITGELGCVSASHQLTVTIKLQSNPATVLATLTATQALGTYSGATVTVASEAQYEVYAKTNNIAGQGLIRLLQFDGR